MDSSTHGYPLATLTFGEEGKSFGDLSTTGNVGNTIMAERIISNTSLFYIKLVVVVFMTGCVSVIGIVTNVINIIVFVRQGVFTDSSTVSLLGLAVSDVFCVTFMLWWSICLSIVSADPPGLTWEPLDVGFITAGWPHFMFAQLTRMITAYVAFERCVCVVFPFKVRTLFTPKRSGVIIASLFICCGVTYCPNFIAEQLQHRTDPITNNTRLVFVQTHNARLIVRVMFLINSMGFNLGSVGMVFICTMITVSRVKLSKSWRKSLETMSSSKSEASQLPDKNESNQTPSINAEKQNFDSTQEGTNQPIRKMKSKGQRETKLVWMIISISVLFLICFIPELAFLLASFINTDIRFGGKYDNLANAMYTFIFLMETVNSSINIFIYYKMSSRYKIELNRLFGW